MNANGSRKSKFATEPLVDQGKLKVIVDKIFSLEQVVEAHEYMTQRRRVGKVVLSIK